MKRGPARVGVSLIKNIFRNLFAKSHKANSLDIWYVTSSRGLLQSVFKLCPEGKKGAASGLVGFT